MSMIQGLSLDYMTPAGDRGQTITWTAGLGGFTFPVNGAVYEDLTQKEIADLGGLFGAGDRRWLLGAREFKSQGQPPPTQGDGFRDAQGVVWEVALEVTIDPLANWYTVHTVRGR